MDIKEYGSEFNLNRSNSKKNKFNKFIEDKENCLYVKSGRDAIRIVAKIIKNQVKSVLMPSFCCESMIKPIMDEGINIKFYKITNELFPDRENIDQLIADNDALLFMNFFGREVFAEDYLLELKNKYPKLILIEDRTHEILDKKEYCNITIDYTVASLRKWFALPDGGVVYGDINDKVHINEQETSNYFSTIRKEALFLKEEYLQTGEISLKSKYRKLLNMAEEYLQSNSSIETMSKLSREIIYENDYEFFREKRKLNYQTLNNELSKIKNIKFLLASTKNNPLYFPIITDKVSTIQKMLANRSIYCPVIWPTPQIAKGICKNSEYIAEHILAIPCDHRYNSDDMKYIVKNLIEILNLI